MKWLPLIALALPLASTARADDEPASRASFAATFDILPAGKLVTKSGNNASTDTDLTTGVGFGLEALYSITPNVAVGLAPRFATNIKGASSTNSDTTNFFDLRALLEAHFLVAPKLHVLGYVAGGYGIADLPTQTINISSNPAGPTLSFGGGATYNLTDKIAAMFTLGYELGFETATVTILGISGSGDAKYDHMIVSFGVRSAM